MNIITDLPGLEDNDVIIANITIEESTKSITLKASTKQSFCPVWFPYAFPRYQNP
ncbi:MAG: hypothetical protein J6H31_11005 [Butyrivibrio sp.]|nr:hypothetical protein [Butyrivibrio sp.]